MNKIDIRESISAMSLRGKITLISLLVLGLIVGVSLFFVGHGKSETNQESVSNLPSLEDVNIEDENNSLNNPNKEIEVLENEGEEARVAFYIEDFGRSNPFLPPAESISNSVKYGFDLLAPPQTLPSEEEEATKIVTTKVSGIMYNNNSASAILNIEGSDYLVKSGDYINNYKVLAIAPDTVTVQLGDNVYKARVGEVITESLNHNTIDNLSNKFGGAYK